MSDSNTDTESAVERALTGVSRLAGYPSATEPDRVADAASALAGDSTDDNGSTDSPTPRSQGLLAETTVAIEHRGGDDYAVQLVPTGEERTGTDPAALLQAAHDDLDAAGHPVDVQFQPGFYKFKSQYTHTQKGRVITGPPGQHWQMNRQAPVLLQGRGMTAGQALISLGDDEAQGGDKSYVGHLRIKVADATYGIRTRSAGTPYVEHVKVEAVPAGGHGIEIRGSNNATLDHCYVNNLAIVDSPITGDGTNSLNMESVICNSDDPQTPVMLADGDGWEFQNVYLNAIDGADLEVPVLTSPEGGKLHRIRWSLGFCGGVAPVIMDSPTEFTMNSVRVLGGDVGVRNPRRFSAQNCRFGEHSRAAVETDVGLGRNTFVGNRFQNVGDAEDARGVFDIAGGNGHWNWVVVGNTFTKIDAPADVVIDSNSGSFVVGCNAFETDAGIDNRSAGQGDVTVAAGLNL